MRDGISGNKNDFLGSKSFSFTINTSLVNLHTLAGVMDRFIEIV